MEMEIPHRQELCSPVFQAIKELGGSATKQELNDTVARNLRLSEAEINKPYGPNPAVTELWYELAWALTELKLEYGLIDNRSRGVWALTELGSVTDTLVLNPKRGSAHSNSQRQRKTIDRVPTMPLPSSESGVGEAIHNEGWRADLLEALQNMPPDAFERLCQRLLRESGFVEVKVTGRSDDGGIDGVGRVKLGGLLGFPIVFQCRRWRGAVSANIIREFRGSMMGRADRGLTLTTSTFAREARQEATRDGAPPIDLLDGEELLDKLKELRLGVSVKMIEEVVVDPRWFEQL
jgi:restriction system protein